ncbi:Hypothetical predicted protein [Octopus vulgaris]|uniref:Uncharacterized protein n=1 Tax=Octopus vulgaris TaxID=6645 RepID=A0AA36F4B3_OCTVU|nr:Hypothetical predicted protein [Octopus vulgaris]
MKSRGIVPEDTETLSSDRVGWRTKVWSGVKSFEEARLTQDTCDSRKLLLVENYRELNKIHFNLIQFAAID